LAEVIPNSINREAFRIGTIGGLTGGIAVNLFIVVGLYLRQVWTYWLMIFTYSIAFMLAICSLTASLSQTNNTFLQTLLLIYFVLNFLSLEFSGD
jgi:uncharacterized membrane protein